MNKDETGRDNLMDALLREDARGSADEALLAEVEKALGGEEAAAAKAGGGNGSIAPLAWAALLVVSVGVAIMMFPKRNEGTAGSGLMESPHAGPAPVVIGGPEEQTDEVQSPSEAVAAVLPGKPGVGAGPDRAQAMRLRVEDVVSKKDQTPTRLSFTYKVNGQDKTDHFSAGANWPGADSPEAASFPFLLEELPDGRQGIGIYMARLVAYLAKAGADSPEQNKSLLIDTNYRANEKVARAGLPALGSDPVIVLRDSVDMRAFTEGFHLATLMRTHLGSDVNVVESGKEPGGEAIYPELVLFTPEMRFGVRQDPENLDFQGQLNYAGARYSDYDGRASGPTTRRKRPVSPARVSVSEKDAVGRPLPVTGRKSAPASSAPSAVLSGGRGREQDEADFDKDRRRGLRPKAERPAEDPVGDIIDRERPPVDRERYGQLVDQPWKTPWKAPLSTFSVDVDTASYTNIRRMLRSGVAIPKDSVRLEECVNYFDYDYAPPRGGGPFAVHVDLASCPWAETHHLVKIGIKGKEVTNNERPPSNLVFLIDVSGSMRSQKKLPLLVESMKILVEELDERDSVGIVVYAGSAGTLLEPTKVVGNNRELILGALDSLTAGGSTAGAAGIRGAYELAAKHYRKDGVNRVILATDGDFNVGTSSQGELVDLVKEKAKSGVYLSVLGFGTGNINDAMMEAVTNAGNGNYFYIDSIREGRKVFLKDMTGTLVAIAKDVKLQLEFNPGKVAAYRLIGYANRILRDEDFNNDKIDAGDIGAGHTVTALYEIVPVGVKVPETGEVDALKYQKPAGRDVADSPEWMTVKLRYKKPDGDKSTLLEMPVKADPVDWRAASPDYLFAAAVAMFGEKLRESDKIGGTTWQDIGNLVLRGSGKDPHGYRAEFLALVGQAAELHEEVDAAPADPAPEEGHPAAIGVEAPKAE